MADPAGGGDVSAWVQVGGVIGAIIGGAFLVVRGRWGEANPAISQTRAEATEVFVRETQQNRDALLALRELLASEKELLVVMKDALLAMRDAVNRIIPIQENIAAMMREQRESEKEMERQSALLRLISEREAEKERGERERERNRDRDRDRRLNE